MRVVSCSGGLCEKGPEAAPGQTWPAPVDPPQDTVEPIRHECCTSVKNYVKRGQKMLGRKRRRGKSVTNSRGKQRSEKKKVEGEEKMLPTYTVA